MTDYARLLDRTAEIASAYLGSLDARPVGRPVDLAALRAAMGGAVAGRSDGSGHGRRGPGRGRRSGPRRVAPGRATSGSWSAAACPPPWQPTGWPRPGTRTAALYAMSPAAAVAEEVAAAWLVELLDLPAGTSVGFVTGATMANFTALAAARHGVLARAGWDVERLGLQGAPPVTVVTHAGTPRHGLRLAPDARASGAKASASAGSPPTTRAGCDPTPCARRWPGSTARRSCAPRPAT